MLTVHLGVAAFCIHAALLCLCTLLEPEGDYPHKQFLQLEKALIKIIMSCHLCKQSAQIFPLLNAWIFDVFR